MIQNTLKTVLILPRQTLVPVLMLAVLFAQCPAFSSPTVHSVSKAQMRLLKSVDEKYQENHGIHLQLKKVITLALLGSQKSSEGELWLDHGNMRMNIQKPEESQVVAVDKTLWIQTPGMSGEKPQVLKTSLSSKQAQAQALVQLLSGGGVLKHFRVTGVQVKERKRLIYFLQPDDTSVEFKRAQVLIDAQAKEILELKYWDQIDNETKYIFNNVKFNQQIDRGVFAYKPPQGADITVF